MNSDQMLEYHNTCNDDHNMQMKHHTKNTITHELHHIMTWDLHHEVENEETDMME